MGFLWYILSALGACVLFFFVREAADSDSWSRVVAVGFGWAAANAVLSDAVPFATSLLSTEFDWRNVLRAVHCNINLVSGLFYLFAQSFISLSFRWRKYHLQRPSS